MTLSFHRRAGWSVSSFPDLDSERTLLLLFAAPSLVRHPEPIAALGAAFPKGRVLGCSTAGEICGAALRDDSLCAAVVRFTHSNLRQVTLRPGADPVGAGRAVAQELTGPRLRAVLALMDLDPAEAGALCGALGAALPPGVVLWGGLAGDGPYGDRGWLLSREGDEPMGGQQGLVSAVGLYGATLRTRSTIASGFSAAGPERAITRAAGATIAELDGQPALVAYLSDLGAALGSLPVASLHAPLRLLGAAPQIPPVRAVLAIDGEELVLGGDVPAGAARAQVLRAEPDDLIAGAGEAAAALGSGPGLALAFGCSRRRLLLGPWAEQEVEAVHRALPAAALLGCIGNGQIGGPGELYNQCISLALISE